MNRKLLKNSFIYVVSEVFNKALPFFLLPILTRYLTVEDYGIISIFTVTMSMFAVFTGLSIHGAINVNYFKLKKEELKEFIGNTIILLSISTLIVFILVFLLTPFILERLNLEKGWLFIAVILAFAQFLTTINLLLWMVEQRPKPYSLYLLSKTVVTTSLSIIFIIGMGMNWEGRLLAQCIGIVMFSTISFIFIVKRDYLIFKVNKKYIIDALNFGVPLIPHQIAKWSRTGINRLLIINFIGVGSLGIYAVSFQLALIVSVLVEGINKAWTPHLYRVLSQEPTKYEKLKIVRYIYIYMLSLIVFVPIIMYLFSLLIPYILGDNFHKSAHYIFWIGISFALHGMYLIVVNFLFYQKNTQIIAKITFLSSILHLIIAYFLIQHYAIMGAVIATLIINFIILICTWFYSNKNYPMPWSIKKIILGRI